MKTATTACHRSTGGTTLLKHSNYCKRARRLLLLAGWLTMLLGLLAPAAQAQLPAFDYATANGPVDESHNRIAIDALGNTYVTGYFHDTTHFGAFTLVAPGITTLNLYVAKFGPTGQCLWAQQIGGTSGASGADIAVDAAGFVYLAGFVGSGPVRFGSLSVNGPAIGAPFVAKLDGTGRWRWVTLGSGVHMGINALALDAQAGVFITGTFSGPSATFGTTVLPNPTWTVAQEVRNLFVARLDTAGTWQWASAGGPVVAGLNEVAGGDDIAADNRGNVLIVGGFVNTVRLGTTTLTSAGNFDIVLAQLNATTGAWQWARQAGGPDEDAATSIAADATGHAVVTGAFYSPVAQFGNLSVSSMYGMGDAFVARLDTHGTFQWVSTGGGTDDDLGTTVVVDANGAAYVGGQFRETLAQFGPFLLPHQSLSLGVVDMFVAKLDSLGNYVWAVSGASRGNDHVDGLALAGPDDVVISGRFECDSARFGLNTLAGDSNRWNHYLARLSAGPPLLRTVVPASGASGQVVTVSGTHLSNVTSVLFNGVPAPAFSIRSTTTLRATVPAGAGTGSITARTAAGLSSPGPTFRVQGLATALPAEAANGRLWPNPVGAGTFLQLELPETMRGDGPTQIEFRDALGRVVRQAQFSGRGKSLSVQGLAPGLYQVALLGAGQPVVYRRLVVE